MDRFETLHDSSAMAFVLSQVTYIERELNKVEYPEIQYPMLMPVDFSAPDWIKTVTYFTSDRRGRAQWLNGGADDIPVVDLEMAKHETEVHLAGIGYDYGLEEINHARMLGIPLDSEKANAAREASEEYVDDAALLGDAEKGYNGLLDYPGIQVVASPAGVGGTTWDLKTPDEILKDVNILLTGVWSDTRQIETANTLLLDPVRYSTLHERRIEGTDTTLWEFIQRANVYTSRTGQPLTIMSVRGLETAGAGSTRRVIAYNRNPRVLKLHYPMPHRFLPAWAAGPLRTEIPGVMRFGGLEIRRPGAVRYMDGI